MSIPARLPGLESINNNGFTLTFENGLNVTVRWSRDSLCDRFESNSHPDEDLHTVRVSSPNAEISVWIENESLHWGWDDTLAEASPDRVGQIIGAVQSINQASIERLEELTRLGLVPYRRLQIDSRLEAARVKLIDLGISQDKAPIADWPL
jgi:hypothetical protein